MSGRVELDAADLRILNALQEDAGRSIAAVAEIAHLSQNACWRRMKRLEDEGVIRRRVALLDPRKVGLGLTAFVAVRAGEHSEAWLERFAAAVRRVPEVVEFYRLAGEIDYLLKIYVADVAEYDQVYKRLIASAKLSDVTASFAMEELKHTTALPLTEHG